MTLKEHMVTLNLILDTAANKVLCQDKDNLRYQNRFLDLISMSFLKEG